MCALGAFYVESILSQPRLVSICMCTQYDIYIYTNVSPCKIGAAKRYTCEILLGAIRSGMIAFMLSKTRRARAAIPRSAFLSSH